MKSFFILACSVVFVFNSYCQNTLKNLDIISTDNGFPSAYVWTMLRDSKGFMWFGCMEGLIRYDGVNYKTYFPDKSDSTKLAQGNVHCLFEDSTGKIWLIPGIGKNLGVVHVFNPNTESFRRFDFIVTSSFSLPEINAKRKFVEDKNGSIWTSSLNDHLVRIKSNNRGTFNVHKFNINSDTIYNENNRHYIEVLLNDTKDRIWIGTRSGKFYQFDKQNESFISYDILNANPKSAIQGISEGPHGQIWISYRNGRLVSFSPLDNDNINEWDLSGNKFCDSIIYVVKDSAQNLWSLNSSIKQKNVVLRKFNIASRKQDSFILDKKFQSPSYLRAYYQVQINNNGQCLLYVMNTFNLFNEKEGMFMRIGEKPADLDFFNFYSDYEQNIWFSNRGYGVTKFNNLNKKFRHINHDSIDTLSLSSNYVNDVFEDDKGKLWVACANGLNKLELDDKNRIFQKKVFLTGENCSSVTVDSFDNVWVIVNHSFKQDELYKIENEKVHLVKQLEIQNKITYGYRNDIHILNNGKFLIRTMVNGVDYFDPKTNEIQSFYNEKSINSKSTLSGNNYIIIDIDKDGNPWVVNQKGIDRFNTKRETFENVPAVFDAIVGTINDIYFDNKNFLWVASTNGLYLIDPSKEAIIRHFTIIDGLPTLVLFNILEDDKNCLWITSTHGLIKFDKISKKISSYTSKDGLPLNNLINNFKSNKFKRKNGQLLFGTSKGLILFDPANMSINSFVPKTVIVDIKLFNKSILFDKEIHTESIIDNKSIDLNHDQNVISIDYASLSFANQTKNQYAYKIDEIDKDWNYAGNSTTATYAGLNPGEYHFQVISSNNDGIWNEKPASLIINILPPWWKTWWAYSFYTLIIVTISYGFYRLRLNNQLEKAEKVHLQELDEFKSRFYTNITHDFRTPLTIILGVVDQLGAEYQKTKSLIAKNAEILLRLVNQMLELSKLEAGVLKLNLQQSDLVHFLKYILESFHSLAYKKKILINLNSSVDYLIMDFDPDKIQKIISNLLSNALKFSHKNGVINLLIDKTTINNKSIVKIIVRDNGRGIHKRDLAYIFDRYYQSTNHDNNPHGSGIGLAITKELVKLMNGKIEVKSEINVGSEFIVELPITKNAQNQNDNSSKLIPGYIDYSDENTPYLIDYFSSKNNKSKVLLVEDNNDVLNYLISCLINEYKIEVASNGLEAIEKANDFMPDLIICDIMMPKMNGLEACEKLKSNLNTSHIPIILLTAKASEEEKLKGFSCGADAYLIKPFNKKELKIRISKLIELREKIWQHFKENNTLKPPHFNISTPDEKFMTRTLEILEMHKSNPDFGSSELLKELGVSRTFLHIKIKALTGQSTSEFIRSHRLKFAGHLIKQNFGNISEIAYESGFNNLSYFTKCFKLYYGVSPSEYKRPKQSKN